MKRHIVILSTFFMILLFCFYFSACNLFDKTENNKLNDNNEAGFFAELTSQYFDDSELPLGMQPVAYKYSYEYKIRGNMVAEASYNVEVQIAFYVNGEYYKTRKEEYTLSGKSNKTVSKAIHFDFSEFSAKPAVEAKIVKVTWQ